VLVCALPVDVTDRAALRQAQGIQGEDSGGAEVVDISEAAVPLGKVHVAEEPQVPIRPDLLELFDRAELAKYLHPDELELLEEIRS
jgi:hypothetical protein